MEITFKHYLTEESAFSKIRKRPYRILGQFVPSDPFNQNKTEQEFANFINSTNNYMPDFEKGISLRNPQWKGYSDPDSVSKEYHQDAPNRRTSQQMIAIWSNTKPTKIRTISKKIGQRLPTNLEMQKRNIFPGKRVGGDIKPNDVVLLYNRRAVHATDPTITRDDERFFLRSVLIKKKKKKNAN